MPYVLRPALLKVKEKPFNFTLIVGKQKQVLLITPRPAGKSLLDEAKATAVNGEREGKGLCRKVGEQYIFSAKNASSGLRMGIKLAMNNNGCKGVAWDLQTLKPDESDEVVTEDSEGTEKESTEIPVTQPLKPQTTVQGQSQPPQRPQPPTPLKQPDVVVTKPSADSSPRGPLLGSARQQQPPPPKPVVNPSSQPPLRPPPTPLTTKPAPTTQTVPTTQSVPVIQTVPTTDAPSPKKLFDDRFNRIGRDYVKAHAMTANKSEMEKLFTEAGSAAKTKDWVTANAALDKLELLITAALNPGQQPTGQQASTDPQPKVDPRMARIVASETGKFAGREVKAALEKKASALKIHLKALTDAKGDSAEIKRLQTSVTQATQKLGTIQPEGDFAAIKKELEDLEKALVDARSKAVAAQFKQAKTAEEKAIYDHVMAPVGSTRKFAFKPGDADRYEKEMGNFTGKFEKGNSASLAKPPKPTKEGLAAEAEEKKKLKDAQALLAKTDKDLKKSGTKGSAMDKIGGTPEWQTLRKANVKTALDEALAPLNKEFQNTLGALKKLEDAKGDPDPQAVAALQKKADDLAKAIQAETDAVRKSILDQGFADNPSQLNEMDKELYDAATNGESMRQLAVCESISLEVSMRDASLKPVLTAMKKVESDKSRKNIEDLITECNKFLEPLNSKTGWTAARSKELKKKEDNARFILKYARILLIGLESDTLGAPPWDENKRAKASELEVQLFFEENPMKQRARQEGATASGTWFVERIPKDKEGKRTREGSGRDKGGRNDVYIFKPIDAEPDLDREIGRGWKKGGGAPREILSKTVSDSIQEATGLNIGVCPTSLVALDSDKMPDATGGFADEPKRTGALQEMSQCLGSFDDFNKPERPKDFDKLSPQQKKKIEDEEKKKKDFLAKVPDEDYSKLAVFDLMTLQMDRHGGNILMTEDADGNARMTPIDHGLSMPNKQAYASTAPRMMKSAGPGTSGKNVLMTMPQADKMLDESVVKSLELLDPDKIEAEMKASYNQMKTQHPDSGELFDENKQTGEVESFTIVKRSVMFLKKAASQLTAAELFGVYGGTTPKGGGKVLDPEFLNVVNAKDDNEVNDWIDKIIAKVIANRTAT